MSRPHDATGNLEHARTAKTDRGFVDSSDKPWEFAPFADGKRTRTDHGKARRARDADRANAPHLGQVFRMVRQPTGGKRSSRPRRILRGVVAAAVTVLLVENASDETDSAESPANKCFAQLAGDPCADVWHRTRRVLGEHHVDTNDALHSAFLYVCLEKRYEVPQLCGAFRLKAMRLKIDAWRYSRRFRVQPAPIEPACPFPSADDEALSEEELDLLDDARARLDERSRFILDLAYRDGFTDAEIAALIKPALSVHRVRVLRREAERELEHLLKRCRRIG